MGIKFDDITDESLGLKLISVNFGAPEPALLENRDPRRRKWCSRPVRGRCRIYHIQGTRGRAAVHSHSE